VFIQPDDKVFSYLRKLGYSEQGIAGMSRNTRLFHDMHAAIAALKTCQLLEDEFGVDLSGFEFARYFPPEFAGRSRLEAAVLISCIPFANRLLRSQTSYAPLTLAMIEQAMQAGRWTKQVP
jgi:hypothetical protein